VVLPEPTGPAMMRPYASDFINDAHVGEAIYSRSATSTTPFLPALHGDLQDRFLVLQ